MKQFKDTAKPRLSLLVSPFLLGMAAVMTKGLERPGRGPHSYLEQEDAAARYYDALMRHALEQGGVDPDTGLSHWFSVACNAMICWAIETGWRPR